MDTPLKTTLPVSLQSKKIISISDRDKQPPLEKRLRAPRKRSSVSAFREGAVEFYLKG